MHKVHKLVEKIGIHF